MQKTLTRILSTPAFSNLLECDLYLCRYFTYLTGMPSSMSCPRAYRSSIAECKLWALGSCKSITMHERMFLTNNEQQTRHKRSNRNKRSWMCHAGFFGLFRSLYQATGRSCEPNHVEHLKTTLRDITSAIRTSQMLIRSLHGKQVYITKTTDSLATKLNHVSNNIRRIDTTFYFHEWEQHLDKYAGQQIGRAHV